MFANQRPIRQESFRFLCISSLKTLNISWYHDHYKIKPFCSQASEVCKKKPLHIFATLAFRECFQFNSKPWYYLGYISDTYLTGRFW